MALISLLERKSEPGELVMDGIAVDPHLKWLMGFSSATTMHRQVERRG